MSTFPLGSADQPADSLAVLVRETNDAIWRSAARQDSTEALRIVCECEDVNCDQTLLVTVNDYLKLRTSPLLGSHL